MPPLDRERNRRILIVDDDPAIRSLFRDILVSYEVDTANSGEEGLALVDRALAEDHPYALAFVDMRMPPGWDGVETIRRFWEKTPDLQVVICTAFTVDPWPEITNRLGPTDSLLILKKPFDLEEAVQLTGTLTEKWRQTRQARRQVVDLELAVAQRTAALRQANAELEAQIAERQRSEEALRQSEARYRAVFEQAADAIVLLDADGRITAANSGACQTFGHAWAALAGLPVAQLLGPPLAGSEEAEPDLAEFLLGDGELRERRVGHVDGRTLLIEGRARRLEDGQCLLILRDITTRRRAEVLEQERNSLHHALRAHERVLGVVGHELRTPLAALRATSEFLLTDGAATAEELATLLKSIHDETLRMSGTVNDLLEVARLNSGTARWNWSEVSLARACGEALESMRPLLDPRKVHLTVSIQPPDLAMRGDAAAVRRLVLNLVDNAAKFTARGSIHVTAAPAARGHQRFIEVQVRDTGKGMTPETAARLGEAFALNTGMIGDGDINGSGLGLAICKGIVTAHGGTLSVASARGKGTQVTAMLRADLPKPRQTSREPAIIHQRLRGRLRKARVRGRVAVP